MGVHDVFQELVQKHSDGSLFTDEDTVALKAISYIANANGNVVQQAYAEALLSKQRTEAGRALRSIQILMSRGVEGAVGDMINNARRENQRRGLASGVPLI